MQHAVALGSLADRNGEQRHARACRDLDAFLGDEAFGLADGRGRARNIGKQELDLAPVDPAPFIDHVAGDLHGRVVLDAVLGGRPGHRLQHSDLDRLLRGSGRAGQDSQRCRERQISNHCSHDPISNDEERLTGDANKSTNMQQLD
jgi:hypothetical protein